MLLVISNMHGDEGIFRSCLPGDKDGKSTYLKVGQVLHMVNGVKWGPYGELG